MQFLIPVFHSGVLQFPFQIFPVQVHGDRLTFFVLPHIFVVVQEKFAFANGRSGRLFLI